ncbi:MAG: hypothetical protein RMJ98_17830 [Myxococcales bacterium]|nr:hypothetical protein [Polyangiaceae bacterium]MDW8251157.1 hypothetical protein [Myxococcales bacterium]
MRNRAAFLLPFVLLGVSRTASAEELPAPVFPGHPYLTLSTKEVSGDGSVAWLSGGQVAFGVGSSMAAFYAPWFSILGGAQGGYVPGTKRQTYDTRAVLRFVWPEPLRGRVFVYGGVGMTVFFVEGLERDGAFRRGLGPLAAAGAWVQLTEKFRLRAEVRDQ